MNKQKQQLRVGILKYLIDHPYAQDTITGIVTWWLLEQTIKHTRALVKEVLDELANNGLIIAQQGSDSQIHYKINQSRYDEIISIVQPGS
jgi:hypothetical protein